MFWPSLTTVDVLLRAALLGPLALLWIIATVRLLGLSSLSKMTAFDAVVTLATGSLLATAASASSWSSYLQAIAAIAVLLLTQAGLAVLRRSSKGFRDLIENEPVLLVHHGRLLHAPIHRNRVTEADIWAKLREAGVHDLQEVFAVVLETTGDVAIIRGDRPDEVILHGVRGTAAD